MSVITISRGTKSGGVALAEMLSKRLGYDCISSEVIHESAKTFNIDEKTLELDLEQTPSFWQKFSKEHHRYLIFVKCSLLRRVMSDNVIYHGHAGQLFLDGVPHVLKLRIVAPFEKRVLALRRETGIDEKEAASKIQQLDEQREKWVQYLYDKDWSDPSLYDLVINLDHISLETACELVEKTLKRKEFKTTEKSRLTLANQSLVCEIEAGLVADDELYRHLVDRKIWIDANSGTVTLRGVTKTKKQRKGIEETAVQVKGVRECKNCIELLSDPLPKTPLGHGN